MCFSRFVNCIVFLCIVIIFSGCTRSSLPTDLPKLYPVSITITQDGKPLADASVTLLQTSGAAKWSAMAITNGEGIASPFFTNGMYQGVVEGTFKVSVLKMEKEQPAINGEIPPEPTDPHDRHNWYQKYFANRPPVKSYFLVETQYTDSVTTPLEAEIKSGQNQLSFDVGKPVRILFQR